MFLLLLSFACTDPNDVAKRACEAVPGLSMDAEGQAVLAQLLVASELESIKGSEQTEGHKLVGDAGLATIRDGAQCTVDSVDSAGSGRWAVVLTRTAPSVGADGAYGEPQNSTLEWQVVSDEGGRVEAGVAKAATMWANAKAARDEGDLMRAASSMRALRNTFPDPVLAVDVALMEQAEEVQSYTKSIVHTFLSAEGEEVIASVQNGDKALSKLVATATFDVGSQEIDLGPIEAGAALEYRVPIPEGAEGSVQLTTGSLELAP